MAATIDFYSSRPIQSSLPYEGELMEALEPFMKSTSSTRGNSQCNKWGTLLAQLNDVDMVIKIILKYLINNKKNYMSTSK